MSAIGHYLEQEGVPTAGISLVREHTQAMQPPRALWVPFMLGRPLGAPGDPEFQRSVLRALLALFEASSGPALRDFPFDAPVSGSSLEDEEGEACPVNFARVRPAGEGAQALAAALAEEIAQLRPWHDIAIGRRGGTTVGISGVSPEHAGAYVASFLDAGTPPDCLSGQTLGQSLKWACDDLRSYYEEAAGAQPGELSAGATERWFFLQTVAGQVLRAVSHRCAESEDASVRMVASNGIIPRAIARTARGGAD